MKGIKKEDEPRMPRSLFERPPSMQRRDSKLLKKAYYNKPMSVLSGSMMSRPLSDVSADQPEWYIHEDWALLEALKILVDVPLNLGSYSAAHSANWELVADFVNVSSRCFRSVKIQSCSCVC